MVRCALLAIISIGCLYFGIKVLNEPISVESIGWASIILALISGGLSYKTFKDIKK
jgi:hypothetical protein